MGEMQLSLGPDLQMELIRVSQAMDADVSALLNQAMRDHLDHLAEQKIIAESKAFRSMHAELLQRYKGEYVAVHNGEVVDHDVNLGALNRRIRARYGCLAVLLQQVTEQPGVGDPESKAGAVSIIKFPFDHSFSPSMPMMVIWWNTMETTRVAGR